MPNDIDLDDLISRADGGDVAAQERVAFAHSKGSTKDLERCVHYYKLAAAQNSALAQYNLAISLYIQASNQGDIDSQFNLAVLYAKLGLESDAAESFRWFEIAAKNGSPRAQYDLASIYHHGRGVDKDIEKAIFWYSQAAAQGLKRAEEHLFALRNVI